MGNKSKNRRKKPNNASHKKKPNNASRQKVNIGGISVQMPLDMQLEVGVRHAASQLAPELRKTSQKSAGQSATSSEQGSGDTKSESKTYAEIATHLWRAAGRIVDPETKEPKEGFERVARDLERISNALEDGGVKAVDPIGRAYDAGMAMKVLNFEPTPGISCDTILETIRPGVVHNEYLVQWPEVIVGTPIESKNIETKGEENDTDNN